MTISLPEYRHFWHKAKETTSCYPDALLFTTMKAGARSDLISDIECKLAKVSIKSGYSPLFWKKCLDVMILKKSGLTTIKSLRTVVLFPVDCNFVFKNLGRKLMKNVEAATALAPEQFGSHKHHRASALATNKALTYDLMRQLKCRGAMCSNDAKSCYDLIGHTQASLAMQRMGIPQASVDCMVTTLQEAIHRERTGYGGSSCYYGGKVWAIPIKGIGQGNGAGPAIWAVVSTPLLNILREKGFGMDYITPLSGSRIRFSGFAFVDDTDLLHMMHASSCEGETRTKIQDALDCWEGALSAMSGAIVPEKAFWYLIDFHWQAGEWRYKSIAECSGDLTVQDINGLKKRLSRVEVHVAKETLGILLAPNGGTEEEFNKLKAAAADWVEQMKQGKLNRSEVWISLQSTILCTLSYPLQAINLSKKQ
jgi:hypothetical protein